MNKVYSWVQESKIRASNPPCIGALIRERVIYVREEEEGVHVGVAEEEAHVRKERKIKLRREARKEMKTKERERCHKRQKRPQR